MGDELQVKRRNIFDDPPALVVLDEISGDSSQSDSELEFNSTLEEKPISTLTTDEKVDCLIGKMDKFFTCFNIVQKKAQRTDRKNQKKFKHLESAHNDLITKVVQSSSNADSKMKSLEERLARCEDANRDLTDKLSSLSATHDRQIAVQHSINSDNTKKMDNLEMNQGYTDKAVLNLASEVKERKVIISRVHESAEEDVHTAALEAINTIINAAIADIPPDASLGGLRILMPSAIDNVFRVGKNKGGRFSRNISVTFAMKDDKEMLLRAHGATRDKEEIKFFVSDDQTADGRALKAQLKRISNAAKSKGMDSKISGNRVLVGSRLYASNELSLIPGTVSSELKQEKQIDGGIVYRGDRSIFSNFFPAPFNLENEDYVHVEQFFQYKKALHHEEYDTADRILKISNPWRIKVLGDSIEPKSSWNEKRMKTLYEGVSAKFRQNWPLQDELLRSKGLKLYEATTDLYFACGVGYDSWKWKTMDWTGENVAGQIVMKVRDELLLENHDGVSDDITLTQMAVDQDDTESFEPAPAHPSQDNQTAISRPPSSQMTSYTDALKSPGKSNGATRQSTNEVCSFQPVKRYNRGGWRGARGNSSPSRFSHHNSPNRGHGRGRGSGRFYRGGPFNNRRPQDKLSKDDMNFLYGYSTPSRYDEDGFKSPRKTTKSPPPSAQSTPIANSYGTMDLTEHQRKGLIELGLIPDSGFVKNIVAVANKTSTELN